MPYSLGGVIQRGDVQHSQILPGWLRVRSQWLFVEASHSLKFDFEHNLYSGQELEGLVPRERMFGST